MHPLADLTLSHYIEDGRSDVLVEDGVGIFCRLHPVWVGDAPDDVMAMLGPHLCPGVSLCPIGDEHFVGNMLDSWYRIIHIWVNGSLLGRLWSPLVPDSISQGHS